MNGPDSVQSPLGDKSAGEHYADTETPDKRPTESGSHQNPRKGYSPEQGVIRRVVHLPDLPVNK